MYETKTCRKALITLILLVFVFVSCSPERKLAKQFLQNKEPEAILLLAPDFLYKKSYKLPDSLQIEDLQTAEKDSVLLANTQVIQYVDDSTYFAAFMNGIYNELTLLGYKAFVQEQAGDFLVNGRKSVVFNLAQAEIEEYFDSVGDAAYFGGEELYRYNYFITAVNQNFWFEYSGLNHYDTTLRVLFSNLTVTDAYDGGFRYFPLSGDVKYVYNIDSLQTKDIYRSAERAGYVNATYLNDFLMNKYISHRLPKGTTPRVLFTYDRLYGKLRKLKAAGFVEM